MAKVLTISSQVVYGYVGNSTAAFVLQRMGHEVMSLPTVLLSNRPGYQAIAGEPIDPGMLDAILGAAWSNGWFTGLNAILTGYMPTPAHAALCERWIKALDPNLLYVCDPILGDEPSGLYVREEAACAVRDKLVPLADVALPNLFELGWLTGRPTNTPRATVEAARALWRPATIVTSAPAKSAEKLANLLIEPGKVEVAAETPRQPVQAHGTGDFFSAVFLGHRLAGLSNRAAMEKATAAAAMVLGASRGRSELALIETQALWSETATLSSLARPQSGASPQKEAPARVKCRA